MKIQILNWMTHNGKFLREMRIIHHIISLRKRRLSNPLANEGCMIFGTVESSVLSYNVHIGRNSTIKDSVIMPNVRIGENVHIERAIIASNCVIRRWSSHW